MSPIAFLWVGPSSVLLTATQRKPPPSVLAHLAVLLQTIL